MYRLLKWDVNDKFYDLHLHQDALVNNGLVIVGCVLRLGRSVMSRRCAHALVGQDELEFLEVVQTRHVLVFAQHRVRQLADLVHEFVFHLQLAAHQTQQVVVRHCVSFQLHLIEVGFRGTRNPDFQNHFYKNTKTAMYFTLQVNIYIHRRWACLQSLHPEHSFLFVQLESTSLYFQILASESVSFQRTETLG